MKKIIISLIISVLAIAAAVGILVYKPEPEDIGGGYRTQRGPLITNQSTFGSIGSNLLPDGNNTRDIGAYGTAWRNIYASSTAFLDYVSSTQIEIREDVRPDVNDGADLGVNDFAWNNLFVSSTSFLGGASGDQLIVGTSSTLIVKESGLIGFGLSNPIFHLVIDENSGTNGPTLGLQRTDTSVVSGNRIGRWAVMGGELTPTSIVGSITVDGDGTWTDTSSPTRIEFMTTNSGSTVDTIRMELDSNGALILTADIDPVDNNVRDLGSFTLNWNNIFVSSTAFLNSVTTTMIEPWANNTYDLGSYGMAWKDVYVSGTLFATVVQELAHIQLTATTTQTISAVNTPQEVLWGEIESEKGDWLVTDGVDNTTTTIPATGTYLFSYCLEFEKLSGGGTDKFEYALFEDSVLHDESIGTAQINSNNIIVGTCWHHVGEHQAGDEMTLKMSAESTNIRITATSTVFTANPGGATLVITQLDSD